MMPTSKSVAAPLFAAVAFSTLIIGQVSAMLEVEHLRCEYLSEPRGIHETKPRLSWIVRSNEREQQQTAWRVLVASTPEELANDRGDRWDSGKVKGDETCQIPYAGKNLDSRSRCFWKVMVWDGDGEPSEWSEPASWTVGLLREDDWMAKWIDASHMAAPGNGGPPEIIAARYETVDGSVGVDLSGMLKQRAERGPFTLTVNNDLVEEDPAFNTLKQLRVSYRRGGKTLENVIQELAPFSYPDDLPPPADVKLIRASYEAIDGAGANDVTDRLREKAAAGPFAVSVDNEAFGPDPAFNHLKRLRVEYELDGKHMIRLAAEKETLRFPGDLLNPTSVPHLRKRFVVAKPIARATLYATALGIYEMRLNGGRVGDHVLAPEWTDYDLRLNYQEYDVSDMLSVGENVWGAQVADGWYSGHIGNGGFQRWGKSPALFAQLEIEYEDGSKERVATDGSWKIGASATIASDFMMGEDFDARRVVEGWDRPGFDDSEWAAVRIRDESRKREITGQVMEPSRELMELPAKSVRESAPGKWIYDLGQNLVGVVRLKVTAPEGTKITLRHGEILDPDGSLYTTNLRGAPSIDTYICRGGGVETWQPTFTFHGFRYVELSGLESQPPLDAVTGIVIGSDTPATGEFECSDPLINRLYSNIIWGQRGNYLSVPTDCPQRDERLGWMGDAQVFVKTATFNADVAAFFSKWLQDVRDSQRPSGVFTDVAPFAGPSEGTPAWGDAGVICPWTIYRVYGDKRVLEDCYPGMVRWVEWCRRESSDFIRSGNRGADYGDWLSIDADTDKEMIGTAFFAYSTRLLADSAEILGKTKDAATYHELFENIREAFVARYVGADGKMKGDTQCAYAMALKFDLLPERLRAQAVEHLVADIERKEDHLSTGFIGVGYLLPVLTEAGRSDVAYRLIHQDTFPSWLFSVHQGATTIWERWDGWTPEKGFQNPIMNSFNHYSLGSCGEWLYETVGGIGQDDDSPAYKKFVIRPLAGGKIDSARTGFRTIRGEVQTSWKKSPGGFALSVRIPANTTAEVHLPARSADEVREGGEPLTAVRGVRFLRMEKGAAVLAVGSGHYRFTAGEVAPDDGLISMKQTSGELLVADAGPRFETSESHLSSCPARKDN